MASQHRKPGEGDRPDIRTLHLWQIQPLRDILVIALVVGLVYLGSVLSPITVPMLLALTLAYLFEPLVRRIMIRTKASRPIASGLIIFLFVVVVGLPVLVGGSFAAVQGASYGVKIYEQVKLLQKVAAEPKNAEHLKALWPGGWHDLGEFVRDMEAAAPPSGTEKADVKDPAAAPTSDTGGATPGAGEPPASPTVAEKAVAPPDGAIPVETSIKGDLMQRIDRGFAWLAGLAKENTGALGRVTSQLFGTGAEALYLIAKFIKTLALLGFSLFLTLFFFFFFSSQWGDVREVLIGLIPTQNRDRWLEIAGRMDRVIAAFIRGRLTIMAILSVEYVLAYWMIGVPGPLVVGIVVGVLCAVPLLPLLGVPLSIVLMFLMPVGGPHTPMYIVLVPAATYFVIQMTDDYLWTPLIQGKATDMDTPSILFAVLSGALLGGIYGVLLAIPIGACFKIVLKEVLVPRFREWAEGRARDFLPIAHTDEPVKPGT